MEVGVIDETKDEAYNVLDSLVPLSSEVLAENLDEDQLEAVKLVILERIRALEKATTPKQTQSPSTAASPSVTTVTNTGVLDKSQSDHPTETAGKKATTKKKSRWDSDSEDEEELERIRREKKQKKERKPVVDRSLSNSTCRSINCYTLEKRLSEGTYGVVWMGKDLETQEYVAIKKIKFEKNACKDGFPLAALREVNVLLGLKHPNIIHAREMVVGPKDEEDVREGYPPFNVYMVMDLYRCDLRTLMTERMTRPFHQSEVKLLMRQLLEAIRYMHHHWFMHRDLKPANLLYGPGGHLVVCDFGLARTFDDPPGAYTSMVVTLTYRSPELLLNVSDYDGPPVDIWSIGCIFAELLSGKALFPGQTEPEMLNLIWHCLGTPVADPEPLTRSWPAFGKIMELKGLSIRNQPSRRLREKIPPYTPLTQEPYLSEVGMDLLERMLTLDPSHRVRASEALMHDWFNIELPRSKNVGEMPNF